MIYKVIVDISNSEVDRVFDYRGSEGIPVGVRVWVPFGPRIIEGYVIDTANESCCDPSKLKDIVGVIDDSPIILPEMTELCRFMQKRYHLRMIDCLRLFIPAEMRKGKVKPLIKKQVSLSVSLDEALSALNKNAVKQRAVVEFLAEKGVVRTDILNSAFGAAAVKALVDKGIISSENITVNRKPYKSQEIKESEKRELMPSQKRAVDAILSAGEETFLLHGVTGSGKTEVYMTVIENVVKSGKTAIMLVPEISLTPSMMKQFRSRFGDSAALLHSGLSAGERFDEWNRLRSREAVIAVGARSAIFAPLSDVGVIIIDEEHDGSYQSDSNPRYNTFDIAEFRRSYNHAKLISGSATPSLETYRNALEKKIKLLSMPERVNNKPLPSVDIVDMTNERMRGNKSFISEELMNSVKTTVSEGNQVILFLNRRGFSSFVMCNNCGYVAKCTDCDVSLYYHKDENVLKCHYCGKKYRMFDLCPSCKSDYIRQGKIGTEQVVNILRKEIPEARILRMDYDTTQSKEAHNEILKQFADKEANILVGTQMVTKGHDFPFVTLVGVLEGDQSLYLSDYRCSERTFQLITQVAGRSGRKDLPGRVILQTHTPGHFALKYAAKQDYIGFYKREINIREATHFPPYSVVMRILYTGTDSDACVEAINSQFIEVKKLADENPDAFIFLQKMRAPLTRMEGKYRFQILMRIEPEFYEGLYEKIFTISDNHDKKVSVFVEINPQNLT